MLVLSRKPGEQIIIDENIIVQVVKISGNKVRLGIQAPPDVSVVRSELVFGSPAKTSEGSEPPKRG